jgi:MerR family copper efflux transcriptional regulator
LTKQNTLTIGKLAILGGVNVQTIRFYERSGLLPKPPRTSSGYRRYDLDAIRRLRFIKQAQVLGFSLAEIDELLSLQRNSGATCSDVQRRTRQKIDAINEKIRNLDKFSLL